MRASVRRLVVLLCIGLMIVPGQAAGLVSGEPDLSASIEDGTVTPGADTTVQVSLVNEGRVENGARAAGSRGGIVSTARGVEASLEANGAPIEIETGTESLGRLEQGEQAQLEYDIAVADVAEPGTYTLDLVVEYSHTSRIRETSGVRHHESEVREFDLTIEIDDRARFEIISTEATVRAGTSGTIDVKMRNTGSEVAQDTSVSLESRNVDLAFDGQPSTTRYAGDWAPGETRTLSYQVAAAPDARQQRYGFSARATFEDENGVTRTSERLSLGVTPEPEQSFEIVGVDSNAPIGDTGTLAVTLENTGPIAVDDATVELRSQSGKVRFGSESTASRFVGDWEPGTERTAVFDVSVTEGADTRQYTLKATVGYDDPRGNAATSERLSFGFAPAPERGFSLSNVSSSLRIGEEGTVRGMITNEGNETARNVLVRFTTDSQQINPVTRSYSVGTLEPGESASFDINAEVTSAADPGPRRFSFVADYRNSEGEQLTSDTMLVRGRVAPGGDAFAVDPVNATYATGGSGELVLRVTNVRNETLSSISAKLFADDPISAESKEAFISDLAPGESRTVALEVSVAGDAIAETYPVSVDFQYEDSDGDTHVSDSHQVAIEVTKPEKNGGGGVPLVGLVGLGAVGTIGIASYLRFRD